MDFLPSPEVKGYQVFSLITKRGCLPFDLLGNIVVHIHDDFPENLHLYFERMIELLHELIDLLSAIHFWV